MLCELKQFAYSFRHFVFLSRREDIPLLEKLNTNRICSLNDPPKLLFLNDLKLVEVLKCL